MRRVEGLLPGRQGEPGQPAKDNRLFLDAVLWIVRIGAPWRDLPERFGDWNSTCVRFNRWAKKGVWQRVFDALQDPDLEWVMLDAAIILAHVHAAVARVAGSVRRFVRPATGAIVKS
jgi:putative transposase